MIERTVAEWFARETAGHEMTILHEEGIYRHVRFEKPKHSHCWFDLITWPHNLVINGDMGTYHFSRIEDMFDFFGITGHDINPQYWEEKIRGSGNVTAFSEALFRQHVAEYLKEAEEEFPEVTKAFEEEVYDEWSGFDVSYEENARQALDDFEFRPDGQPNKRFTFEDTWEWDLRDYTNHYLWNCHAIQWGISQYREKKAKREVAVPLVQEEDQRVLATVSG